MSSLTEEDFNAHDDQKSQSVTEAHVSDLPTFQWLVEEVMYCYYQRHFANQNKVANPRYKKQLVQSIAQWWYPHSTEEALGLLPRIFPEEKQNLLIKKIELKVQVNKLQAPVKQYWIALGTILNDVTQEWAYHARASTTAIHHGWIQNRPQARASQPWTQEG